MKQKLISPGFVLAVILASPAIYLTAYPLAIETYYGVGFRQNGPVRAFTYPAILMCHQSKWLRQNFNRYLTTCSDGASLTFFNCSLDFYLSHPGWDNHCIDNPHYSIFIIH